jgi:selenocysteine-specific elongation factor
MPGAGTVLTGTLVDGSLAVDDVVTVLPDDTPGRIRSIQSHERSVTEVSPGRRAAISVVGIERTDVRRGSMLGRAEQWSTTGRFAASLRAVRDLGTPIKERGSFHLHLGSGSWPVNLRLIDTDTLEGEGLAVVEASEALPIKWGDRFILREVGRQAVVAGGRVLDPHPVAPIRSIAASLTGLATAGSADDAAQRLLEVRGSETGERLAADTGGGAPVEAIRAGTSLFSPTRVSELEERANAHVATFHTANPLRAGIPKASLAEHLGIAVTELEAVLAQSTLVELIGSEARSVGFSVDLGDDDATVWAEARTQLEAHGFSAPSRAELGLTRELEHALVRSGDLVEVSGDFLYLPGTLAAIVDETRTIGSAFTVAQFRDALGITRKHAIPLLEWLDRSGITVRDGDERRLAED